MELTCSGHIVCWGVNVHGQCNVPENVAFDQVSTSRHAVCGIVRENKHLMCWGLKDAVTKTFPVDVPMEEVSLAWDHGCGILSTGAVTCWGTPLGDRMNVPEHLQ